MHLVISGLTWLFSAIVSLASSVAALFSFWLAKRLALILVIISAFAVLTTSLFFLLSSLITALSVSAPDWLTLAVMWVVPSNLPACISAIVSAHLARWVYEWNIKIISMKAL